jgi:hypothetical protein
MKRLEKDGTKSKENQENESEDKRVEEKFEAHLLSLSPKPSPKMGKHDNRPADSPTVMTPS